MLVKSHTVNRILLIAINIAGKMAYIYSSISIVIVLISMFMVVHSRTRPEQITLPTAHDFSSSQAWLLDRQGIEIARIRLDKDVQRQAWTKLDDISPALTRAVLAAEDARFYRHGGVDLFAVLAAMKDALLLNKPRGASTISMQLAGMIAQSKDPQTGRRSLWQKLTQMRAAWQMESHYSKQEILEAYVNTTTFRGDLQGIASASQAFFGKSPIALTAKEAAVLAVLIRSPQAKPSLVARRACAQLYQIHEASDACDAQGRATQLWAAQLSTQLNRRNGGFAASDQIALHAAHHLLNQAGDRRVSGLSAPLQRYAVQSLQSRLMELSRQQVEDGAVVVLDNRSGEVLTYVGSSGLLSQANEVDAAVALRQAGSTLKPFLYALALEERRITAASLLDDSPVAIQTADGQFIPRNYARDFKGWVSARRALASSLNVPAVRVLGLTDVERFVHVLRAAGLASVSEHGDYYGHSLALGSADVKLLELTNAYRTLANGGMHSEWRFSSSDAPSITRRAISVEAAAIVSDILADNEARALSFGMDSVLRLPFWAAVKTGTSKDMRDNWCLGYSRHYTVGVWVGNASGAPMRDVSGVLGAAPVWADVMQWLHKNDASLPAALPATVVKLRVKFSNLQDVDREELFIAGTQQKLVDQETRIINTSKNLAMPSILSPLQGAIYALDPDIPLARQKLELKRSAGQGIWRMDGVQLERLSQQTTHAWVMSPGKHRLELLNEERQLAQSLSFEVRVPPSVAIPRAGVPKAP